jgi:hypothetical protein
MILDNTTRSLEIVLGGAITTNQLPFVVSYIDIEDTTFGVTLVISNNGVTNSTTAVTVVAAPGSNRIRQIKTLSVTNIDTVAATVILNYNDNGTLRRILKVTLAVDDNLIYSNGEFRVIDVNGREKMYLPGYQPLDASLTAYAALVTAADKGLYFTGADSPALFDLTSVARTLVAQTTQANMRNTGLGFTDPILDKAAPGEIGATTPAAGTFTSLMATSNATISGTLVVNGGIAEIKHTTGNYGYARIQSGSLLWDVAVKDDQYSGGLQLRYSGGGPQVLFQVGGEVNIPGNTKIGGNTGDTPSYTLHVTTTGTVPAGIVSTAASSTSYGPWLELYRNGGNSDNGHSGPAISFEAQSSNGTKRSFAQTRARILTATNGSEDGELYLRTIRAGTMANRGYMGSGLVIGSPTGGDKGAGTINATAVYDDNVLLTGAPMDIHLAIEAGQDITDPAWQQQLYDKYDAMVPDRWYEPIYREEPVTIDGIPVFTSKPDNENPTLLRQGGQLINRVQLFEHPEGFEWDGVKGIFHEKRIHKPLRKLLARVIAAQADPKYDPLTVAGQYAHFRNKGHLTAFPNESKFDPANKESLGERHQKVHEQLELFLIAMAKMDARIKQLEQKIN